MEKIRITFDNLNLIEIFFETKEVNLLRLNEPKPGVFIAESTKVIERALKAGYTPLKVLVNTEELHKEDLNFLNSFNEVPVYLADNEIFSGIKGFNLTRGIMCLMLRKENSDASLVIKDKRRVLVMEDVLNPTNMGAIIRTAAALKIDGILITEGSADPLYRRALRVSMGTIFNIPWAFVNKDTYMDELKDHGFKTAALALRDDIVEISDPSVKGETRLAILMGNEGNGLSDETVNKADYVVKIPMNEGIDSLNVSAAAAIAMWELSK